MGAAKSVVRLLRPSRVEARALPRRGRDPRVAAAPPPGATAPTAELLNRLKDVYVDSSTDVVMQENPFGSERLQQGRDKLPQDRSFRSEEEQFSVAHSTEGYLSLHTALEVLQRRGGDEGGATAEELAKEYKISAVDAENLLKYFSAYRVKEAGQTPDQPLKFHLLHQ